MEADTPNTLCDSCARGADECSFMARLIPCTGVGGGEGLHTKTRAREAAVYICGEGVPAVCTGTHRLKT